MTEDYKKNTLDYLTGNLELENMKSNSFRDASILSNNLVQKLTDAGVSLDGYNTKVMSSNTTSNYLMYGNGYIIVFDQDGNVLKIITQFDSGTPLADIKYLNSDEEGNIYGIDMINSKYRVILLNNVALKTSNGFVCKLRASYYIPNTSFKVASFLSTGAFIKKDPSNNSTYYIVGMKFGTTSYLMLIKFTINVGSDNTWDYYQGASIGSYVLYACDFILQSINNTIVADIYYMASGDRYTLRHDYFNGSTLANAGNVHIPNQMVEFRAKNSAVVYVTARTNNGDDTYNLYLYELNGGVLSTILQKTVALNLPNYQLNITDNILFTKITGYTNNGLYEVQCGVYYGSNIIESEVLSMEVGDYIISTPCMIQKVYSLYKFLVQSASLLYRPSIVIYDNSYSGESYINYNCLVPLHSELYSGENIVFARTLYNKSSLNNTTTSVLEIPFNYINDIQITTQNLLSATQLPIINSTNAISKNIYENVFLNFINTINVTDEDDGITYPEVATYINNSINTGTQEDYEGISIQKVHINTNDNIFTQTIYWNRIDDTHLETIFTIYVDSTPSTIEFMNMDETYTYLTKDISNLEVGKYYTISQKIRME